ncbi:MAG TPA: RNA polymerase sigma factor [Gemmatimonadales bacterium]|nr:RNA polymerase sigma factor [Gemmatimonadales bacterium]
MTEFDALYERYAPIVLRYALFLCGDRALANDITSETFVRVWAAAGPIRHDTVRAYLFTIARNLYRDSWRRSRRHEAIDEGVRDMRASAEKLAEDRSELGFVWSAMAELPEADRALLLMRAHEELSYRDIATALGVSVAAAKVRVHRARLRLLSVTRARARAPGEEP